MNKFDISDHITENHDVYRKGKTGLLIDGKEYTVAAFQKFLTNKYLNNLDGELILLDDGEKKAVIRATADYIYEGAGEEGELSLDDEYPLPEESILHNLSQTSEDLMKYRPVKDVKTGNTHMFCLTSEMIAEMDVASWLELAPKSAAKVRSQPCIALYAPTEMRKCYAGKYSPTSEEGVEIEVLYINEHIKPEWRALLQSSNRRV